MTYRAKPAKPRPDENFMVGKRDGRAWITNGAYLIDVYNCSNTFVFSDVLKGLEDGEGFNASLDGKKLKMPSYPDISHLYQGLKDQAKTALIQPTHILWDRRHDMPPIRMFFRPTQNTLWTGVDDALINEMIWFSNKSKKISNVENINFYQIPDRPLSPIHVSHEGLPIGLVMPVQMQHCPPWEEFIKELPGDGK